MINTFLFDLDGTLLPMDFDKFMELYIYNMGKYFKDLISTEELRDSILAATEKMIKTKDNEKNVDTFMNYFETLVDGDIEKYKTMFDSFYDSLFENVKPSTYPSEYMRKSVDLLKDKGYEIVIATNPLFPLKANYHRIRWAGFKPSEFSHITSFEENSYCKPHIEFYEEVLSSINKTPEECMMVGNDVFDDLPAGKLGLETYLISNCMLNKYNQENTANNTGTYEEFYEYVKTLEQVK